jgi:lysophospholipid acyltransferase (LPLAT)-like uncharacterized protein
LAPGARGVRFAWLARLIGAAMASYVALVGRTARVSGEITRDQVVLAFWHEFNLAVLAVARTRRLDLPHTSFSTHGFRGVVISAMLERSAVRILTLPPETDRAAGRAFALRMATLGREGWSLVVTPDGPFGPYRVAKPGAAIVARAAGVEIEPWAIAARPALRLRGRWDRHLVPLPFSRLRLVAGDRMRIEEREPLKPAVARLQAALDDVTRQAERR